MGPTQCNCCLHEKEEIWTQRQTSTEERWHGETHREKPTIHLLVKEHLTLLGARQVAHHRFCPRALRGAKALSAASLTSGLGTMRWVLCYKPPSLQYFVTAALGNIQTLIPFLICNLGHWVLYEQLQVLIHSQTFSANVLVPFTI